MEEGHCFWTEKKGKSLNSSEQDCRDRRKQKEKDEFRGVKTKHDGKTSGCERPSPEGKHEGRNFPSPGRRRGAQFARDFSKGRGKFSSCRRRGGGKKKNQEPGQKSSGPGDAALQRKKETAEARLQRRKSLIPHRGKEVAGFAAHRKRGG